MEGRPSRSVESVLPLPPTKGEKKTTKNRAPKKISVVEGIQKEKKKWRSFSLTINAYDCLYVFSRLRLGAKVPRKSEIRLLNDDVERRLQKKLGVGRRKSAEDERPKPLTKNETSGDSDDEENLKSRTSAFVNQRTPPTATRPRKKRK